MLLEEYVALKSAYNALRAKTPQGSRLSFQDIALLSYMKLHASPKTIARFALVCDTHLATMSSRMHRLCARGLLELCRGKMDKRTVYAAISQKGQKTVEDAAEYIAHHMQYNNQTLQKSREYIEQALAALCFDKSSAKEFVLLLLYLSSYAKMTLTKVSCYTKLSEPTVFAAVAALEMDALLVKERDEQSFTKEVNLILTHDGKIQAKQLASQLKAITFETNVQE